MPKIIKAGRVLTSEALNLEMILQENTRKANEQTRQESEIIRQQQESNRQTNTATAISNAEIATERANISAQNAEDVVDGFNLVTADEKGVANGVATLDEQGKIYANQLPSYVDDIIDAYVLADSTEFSSDWLSLSNEGEPLTPETGKIYIILNGDYIHRTFRWSGTAFAEISQSIAIGEVAGTAFEGHRGKALEDEIVNKLSKTGDTKDNKTTFVESSSDADIISGEKHSTIFGKITKTLKTLRSKLGDTSQLETIDKQNLVNAVNELDWRRKQQTGLNLVANSSNEYKYLNFVMGEAYMGTVNRGFITGEEFTLSCNFNYTQFFGNEGIAVRVYFYESNGDRSDITYTYTTTDGLYVMNEYIPEGTQRMDIYAVNLGGYTIDSDVKFKELKVEHGDRVTAWNPSFQNLEDSIKENATNISTINTNLVKAEGYLPYSTGDVGTVIQDYISQGYYSGSILFIPGATSLPPGIDGTRINYWSYHGTSVIHLLAYSFDLTGKVFFGLIIAGTPTVSWRSIMTNEE